VAEQLRLNVEDDEHWASQDYGDTIVQQALADFPEEKPLTEIDKHLTEAAEAITRNSIKESTRTGHTRFANPFILVNYLCLTALFQDYSILH